MSKYRSTVQFFDWLNSPELSTAIFTFLLAFLWEVQQMPFYQMPDKLSCSSMIRNCTVATVGDVGIALTSFWVVALLSSSRQWVRQPNRKQVGVFIFVGVLITVIFEALATGWLDIWQYADSMPIVPVLGTGLLPLSMWLLIPPVTLWFVKRQSSYSQ